LEDIKVTQFALKKIILFFVMVAAPIAVIVSVSIAAPEIGGNYPLFRASVGTGDVEGNGSSFHAFTSYDGQIVAFESYASNWVYDGPANQPNFADIFVRDLQSGITSKLTTGMTGGTANDKSFFPSVSHDGRYVAYLSYASNIVPGDTNGEDPWVVDGLDVFLFDRTNGSTIRVSLNYAGQQITGNSEGIITPDGKLVIFASDGINVMPDSSPQGITHLYLRDWQSGAIQRLTSTIDGQDPQGIIHQITSDYDGDYIAFSSTADNLVPNDQNNAKDIFLYNRQTGITTLVSKNAAGFSATGSSGRPQLTPDGEHLVFSSAAFDLVPGDTNNFEDIFLYEIATGNIRLISQTPSGTQANGDNKEPTICEGGRYIAWTSGANNFTPLDINTYNDVFFYDIVQDEIRLVSVDMNGYSPNGPAHRSWLSPDCRYIAFASESDNMIVGDTNEERDIYMGRLIWPFDLSPTSQFAPSYANPGDTIVYRVWVRNLGLETGIASFTTPIPEQATFISGSGTNGAVYNSALDRIEWSGSVMGESTEEVTFSVLVNPAVTETAFLYLDTIVTGDNIGYTLQNVTVVNGFYAFMPIVEGP
jgi:uncharacterized repeat protein (TIGR01451 family)